MSGGSCISRPVTDRDRLQLIAEARATPEFRFAGRRRNAPRDPLLNYEIAFALTPNPLVRMRLENLFSRAGAAIREGAYRDYSGYIYVFHDLADPIDVIKIGRTERDPRKRVAEWNRELAEQQSGGREQNVVLLFAYPTVANEFAERVVHETLRCEHVGDRLNINSGDELSEFFRVRNFRALKIFLRQTLAYVDRFVADKLRRL